MKCRECGSEEHFAAQCPNKGAGKGGAPSPAFPAFTDNGRSSASAAAHGTAPARMYVTEDSDGDEGIPGSGEDTSYVYMATEEDAPDLEEGPASPARPGDRLFERDPWANIVHAAVAAGNATAHAASSLLSTPSAASWVRVSESNGSSRSPTPQAKTPGTAAASARPPAPRPAETILAQGNAAAVATPADTTVTLEDVAITSLLRESFVRTSQHLERDRNLEQQPRGRRRRTAVVLSSAESEVLSVDAVVQDDGASRTVAAAAATQRAATFLRSILGPEFDGF